MRKGQPRRVEAQSSFWTTRAAHLLGHGDGLLVDAGGDGVLVEDDVVGSSLVVDPVSEGGGGGGVRIKSDPTRLLHFVFKLTT